MKNIDNLIKRIKEVVDKHYIGNGEYARFLWQDSKGTRKMGVNEYGCADAMNILYTINAFPRGKDRELCLDALLNLQNKDTGLFVEETHHCIHTTAHCVAAIELFDAVPKYPQTYLSRYFTKEGLAELLDSLDWTGAPWPQSHQGAGIYVIGVLTGSVDLDWQREYFRIIYDNTDPVIGMSRKGTYKEDGAPLFSHLYGWFHYMFNMQYAKKPLKYPETLMETCLNMYDTNMLDTASKFGRAINFAEIDWVYAVNRTSRQTPYRFADAKDRLRDFAEGYIDYLESLDFDTHDGVNDLHMLFGSVCCLAELQAALPGEIESTLPLRLVLDRRPFI